MKKGVAIFAGIVCVLAIFAIKFSSYPVAWIVGLAASIPVYAAILGGLSRKP